MYVGFHISANYDWQTAALQVMWFEDVRAVSDRINVIQHQLLLTTTTTGVPSITFNLL